MQQPVVLPYPAGRALARHGLQVRVVAPDDRRGLRQALADAPILWHVLEPAIAAALLAEAPRLRLIQKLGAALDGIDLEAKARGVAVCHAPGADTQATAEMTLALMLACLRRLPPPGRALAPEEQALLGGEIGGRTVGLVGDGRCPRGWRRCSGP